MNRVIAVIAVIIIAIVALAGLKPADEANAKADYIRIHIRANSNGVNDQNVKYKVRDSIVSFLTPVLAACPDRPDAQAAIANRLNEIAGVADRTLKANGYGYGAKASLRKEEFPARNYDGSTLNAGIYEALIIELGEGAGDNWWCVLFPPLCFIPADESSGENIVYKSKILEIINNWR